MRARLPNFRTVLILGSSFVATMLASCGGGYGGGGSASSTCGGAYAACPPPTVSITAPAGGMTVSGTVAIDATAMAATQYNLTIASVQFYVDGTAQGAPVTTSPYTVNWNSAAATKGSHTLTAKATDSMNDSTTSAGVMVTSTGAAAAAMGAEQVFPTPASKASGVARVSVDHGSGAVSGSVTLSGLEAQSVTLHEGFAGTSGDTVLALAPHVGRTGVWDVPAGAQLNPQQIAAFGQGRLYVLATSAAYPGGEIRGQLTSESIRVTFTALEATPEATAALGSAMSAVAATTVDTAARTLTVHVSSQGVEQTTAAAVTSGAARLAQLTRDAIEPGHWSGELASLSAADLESFAAGGWEVSIAAAAAPQGALRGAVQPSEAARAE